MHGKKILFLVLWLLANIVLPNGNQTDVILWNAFLTKSNVSVTMPNGFARNVIVRNDILTNGVKQNTIQPNGNKTNAIMSSAFGKMSISVSFSFCLVAVWQM
jgi:hypothetical protein